MDNVLISSTPITMPASRALVWTGRVLSGLVITFLLADAIAKLFAPAAVVDATRQLGYAVTVIRPLGVVLLVATLLHAFPRTQVLGALLLTAYLGGATATHVRVGTPCWMPVTMGVVLWAALLLRQPRLRALVLTPPAA